MLSQTVSYTIDVFNAMDLSGSQQDDEIPQGRWLIDPPNFYWDGDEVAKTDPPSVLQGMIFRNDIPKPFKVASNGPGVSTRGKSQSKAPVVYELDDYIKRFKPSVKAQSDNYNPFGRFNTGPSSFMPSPQMAKEHGEATQKNLASKDKSFKPIVGQPDGVEHTQSGYPLEVYIKGGQILELVEETAFGAVYGETADRTKTATSDPHRVGDPKMLPLKVGKSDPVKITPLTPITATSMASFIGEKRSISQAMVMGTSAAIVATNAGFAPNEGAGWEWLHMIAHSMGGLEIQGPQVAANLVAGTAECNTQMIVVEEFIKDYIARWKSTAKLCVMAEMADADRHIGKTIHYHFFLNNEQKKPVEVYIWTFDALSRSNPMTMQNRALRTAGREALKGGGTGKTDYVIGSQPTTLQQGAKTEEITKQVLEAVQKGPPDAVVASLFNNKGTFGGEVPSWVFGEIGLHAPPEQWNQYAALIGKAFGDIDRDEMVGAAQDRVGEEVQKATQSGQPAEVLRNLMQLHNVAKDVVSAEVLMDLIGESAEPALVQEWYHVVETLLGKAPAVALAQSFARQLVVDAAISGDAKAVVEALKQAHGLVGDALDLNIFIVIGSHANRQNLDAFTQAIGSVYGASAALQVKDGFELAD